MIKTILNATGLQYKHTRFPKPPAETYAVYMDDVDTDGPDNMALIMAHSVTIEVYEPYPDDVAEAAIEAALTAAGVHWTKQDRYWLPDEQRYQTIYEFDYTEKRRT